MNSAVVPVPAAVWLFGSGLVGLGWYCATQENNHKHQTSFTVPL